MVGVQTGITSAEARLGKKGAESGFSIVGKWIRGRATDAKMLRLMDRQPKSEKGKKKGQK